MRRSWFEQSNPLAGCLLIPLAQMEKQEKQERSSEDGLKSCYLNASSACSVPASAQNPCSPDECQIQAVPLGPTLFGAHTSPFQCRQVVVFSLPSAHTHTPCPGCTSIHSYCHQQPGRHPIPRENFRQSQFSVLHAACSGTQSPACG